MASFGPALGPVYSALSSEVLWLYTKWLEYRELYAGSSDRIQLLNDSASHYFWMTQHVMWRDILLHIARLTDPPHQGANVNLSLLSLPEVVEDVDMRVRVEAILESTCGKAAFAREYRNKHLAHQDIDHALDRVAPLSMGSRQSVEDVLAAFAEALNEICLHHTDGTMLYAEVRPTDGARSLIHWLNVARQAELERRDRIQDGIFTSEDLTHPQAP
ncbi:MAG: hypothetical protein PF636_08655 [Actinomycetota bacterium]|nr:hypothetical protein [Actinomycetota bacterium]